MSPHSATEWLKTRIMNKIFSAIRLHGLTNLLKNRNFSPIIQIVKVIDRRSVFYSSKCDMVFSPVIMCYIFYLPEYK